MTITRCPQEIFDLFCTDAAKARAKAIEWIAAQPKDRNTIYVIPHPTDGTDWDLRFAPPN